jgi:hypothetical protein
MPKRRRVFTDSLETGYPFLKEDQQVGKMLCSICKSHFSIEPGGRSDILQVIKKRIHAIAAEAKSCSKKVTSYFIKVTITYEFKHTAAEEELFAFHTIKHNHSFRSMDCTSSVIRRLHGEKFSCGRTKCEVVLYGRETWCLTLREKHRLRVFENRVLRTVFGSKRDEATGEWRKLHSGELHNLYSSPVIIKQIKSRRMRWAGHVARMGERRNVYRVLIGKPEGKKHLKYQGVDGRMGSKWTVGTLVGRGVEWIHLAQDRDRWRAVVNAVMNLRVLAPRS